MSSIVLPSLRDPVELTFAPSCFACSEDYSGVVIAAGTQAIIDHPHFTVGTPGELSLSSPSNFISKEAELEADLPSFLLFPLQSSVFTSQQEQALQTLLSQLISTSTLPSQPRRASSLFPNLSPSPTLPPSLSSGSPPTPLSSNTDSSILQLPPKMLLQHS